MVLVVPLVNSAIAMSAADIDNYCPAIRILIIDNYDSYTFNLFQYCTLNATHPPVVVRNDQFEWAEFLECILPNFDAVVISPGPGRPDRQEDFGVCKELLLHSNIPILGVCLGHQGLAAVLGGKIITADPPMHGRLSDIHHNSSGLFAGIPSPFRAVRYHSLIVSSDNLPSALEETAWTLPDDPTKPRIIMGMSHRSMPIWSVQFHPESICTEYGQLIINNFISLAAAHTKRHHHPSAPIVDPPLNTMASPTVLPKPLRDNCQSTETAPSASSAPLEETVSSDHIALVYSMDDMYINSEDLYRRLYAEKTSAFWLDSAKVEPGLSRFSYMGDSSGPLGFDIKYSLETRTFRKRKGTTVIESATLEHGDTFFRWIADIIKTTAVESSNIYISGHSRTDSRSLPFPFFGGLVGYFGYEMKSESLRPHTSNHDDLNKFKTESAGHIPDSAFIFTDRTIIYDHLEQKIYLVALALSSDNEMRATQEAWMAEIQRTIVDLNHIQNVPSADPALATYLESTYVDPDTNHLNINSKNEWMKLAHDRESYIRNIEISNDKINQGETYEVCLTTQLVRNIGKSHAHPFKFYQHLRRRNPAPYGGFLSFGDGLFLASSSPERFLQLGADRWLSMKPIKGTLPRATLQNFPGTDAEREIENHKRRTALETSEKDRSENLMIVDLIRNDLNQISEPRTVNVPHLMVVESYATVHQLVSTIRGKLRADLGAVDAVMRTFPPGSMTGAPKLRTVHILEDLEGLPRGPYSGTLGFFSVTGPAGFSVIIRTAIFSETSEGTVVTIGAGGAIVVLSDPSDEFDEMLLKADSVLPSLVATFGATCV
ncbi:hypothetical protein BASA50_011276 [Batrachochytrium salamandrivorans]|uniref:aminodeoxychorismate synthase n=1 Tax=Batrachochytrium salamandrivorans TaxID=1357716 RepID=A0ABQ8EYY3_9FUNG|nr:hypothetical protein BASA61_009405 [Batrachochytrium salamandrivorans]KAH6587672.1 hypothetical protein BASA50_011276 [Batrachochytrium salamandrivorans]